SGAVAAVDVVAAQDHPGELLGRVVDLVGRLGAAEDPDGGAHGIAGSLRQRGLQARYGPVERLVPGGLAELAAPRVAHEGMGQANVRLRQGSSVPACLAIGRCRWRECTSGAIMVRCLAPRSEVTSRGRRWTPSRLVER